MSKSNGKGQQKSCLSPTGGAAQARRPSGGVIRSGVLAVSGQDRRPSAASYLGGDFQVSRRPSAAEIQQERRSSSETVHHSCLSPNGVDNESARRRPSGDLFQRPTLAPGGSDNEKARRRPSAADPMHHSVLAPMGLDSDKARRRPSTDMVQLSCLAPGGTDSDQTRRRLSVQTQVRRASIQSQFRRPSTDTDDRRPSIESQDRRPSTESQNAIQVEESRINKQLYDMSMDNNNRKASDDFNPCIVVTTIEEDGELTEVDQWVKEKDFQQSSVQQNA